MHAEIVWTLVVFPLDLKMINRHFGRAEKKLLEHIRRTPRHMIVFMLSNELSVEKNAFQWIVFWGRIEKPPSLCCTQLSQL